jgi:hypothetical protein
MDRRRRPWYVSSSLFLEGKNMLELDPKGAGTLEALEGGT